MDWNLEKPGHLILWYFGPIRTGRQIWNGISTSKPNIIMMTIFVMKKFIRTGNYLLLLHESRPLHLSLLNGKNDGFTKNDWQEKHISFI